MQSIITLFTMRNFPFAQSEVLNIVILLYMHHCVILCHGQHYVNLALGKPCQQSSTYSRYIASHAVDNDTETTSHTNGNTNEWWQVDLERPYYIKNILIHFGKGFAIRVSSTTIRIGDTLCTSIPKTTNATITTIPVTCPNMINGQTIRLTKDTNATDKYIEIAEFEVYGCQQGYYGDTCNKSCLTSNCLNNQCLRTTGQCTECKRNYKPPQCTECLKGRYGLDCAGTCGSCSQGSICNPITGHCTRCSAGFILPLCKNTCELGKYGEECSQSCGSCADSKDCNKQDGSCLKCEPGMTPPYCKAPCEHGKYGQNCRQSCGSCAESQDCNKRDGSCKKCVPGRKLPDCKNACTNGTYGSDCVKACHCKDGQPCNVITGECIYGCAPGWTSKTCDQNCETGKYGQDCLQECGHCAGNAVCKVTTGHCRSCTPGLQPPLCKYACKNGTYGGDCSNTCGHCKDGQPCNVITGECIDGCTTGWTGKICDQTDSNDTQENPWKTAVIALSVVIFVVCVLAVVYKISGQSLSNFLMRLKPVKNQYIVSEPLVFYNNATPEVEPEIYNEIAEKAEDTHDGLHMEDGYYVITRPYTDCEDTLQMEEGHITLSIEHASSSMCAEFASDHPRGGNSLGNVNFTGEAVLHRIELDDSKPDIDGEKVCAEHLEPVHFVNTTPDSCYHCSDYLHPVFVSSSALDEETNEDHPSALPPDYLHPIFVSSAALDEKTNVDSPPALPPDYLHPVFVSSAALDEETNDDFPSALPPDYLHPVFVFSAALDEEINED